MGHFVALESKHTRTAKSHIYMYTVYWKRGIRMCINLVFLYRLPCLAASPRKATKRNLSTTTIFELQNGRAIWLLFTRWNVIFDHESCDVFAIEVHWLRPFNPRRAEPGGVYRTSPRADLSQLDWSHFNYPIFILFSAHNQQVYLILPSCMSTTLMITACVSFDVVMGRLPVCPNKAVIKYHSKENI